MVIKKDKDGKEILENLPRGYVIRSMYEMDSKDIVTGVFMDEKGRPLATIIDLDELPDGETLIKVGADLKPVTNEDDPGVYFTHSGIMKLPGVKRNSTWYDFDTKIFIANVLSFFDPSSKNNVSYYKELVRRERRSARKEAAAGGGPTTDLYLS
ncbi:unnamed protein product [Cuscuta epithymum]|uniref:Uncharacterized protein n=1 Tax=Cuscuta epithymum TaxID=186058 RepID=A0AAV0CVZ8_9ASTE|nr:unnamed protein product [Cuscuta epithymum]